MINEVRPQETEEQVNIGDGDDQALDLSFHDANLEYPGGEESSRDGAGDALAVDESHDRQGQVSEQTEVVTGGPAEPGDSEVAGADVCDGNDGRNPDEYINGVRDGDGEEDRDEGAEIDMMGSEGPKDERQYEGFLTGRPGQADTDDPLVRSLRAYAARIADDMDREPPLRMTLLSDVVPDGVRVVQQREQRAREEDKDTKNTGRREDDLAAHSTISLAEDPDVEHSGQVSVAGEEPSGSNTTSGQSGGSEARNQSSEAQTDTEEAAKADGQSDGEQSANKQGAGGSTRTSRVSALLAQIGSGSRWVRGYPQYVSSHQPPGFRPLWPERGSDADNELSDAALALHDEGTEFEPTERPDQGRPGDDAAGHDEEVVEAAESTEIIDALTGESLVLSEEEQESLARTRADTEWEVANAVGAEVLWESPDGTGRVLGLVLPDDFDPNPSDEERQFPYTDSMMAQSNREDSDPANADDTSVVAEDHGQLETAIDAVPDADSTLVHIDEVLRMSAGPGTDDDHFGKDYWSDVEDRADPDDIENHEPAQTVEVDGAHVRITPSDLGQSEELYPAGQLEHMEEMALRIITEDTAADDVHLADIYMRTSQEQAQLRHGYRVAANNYVDVARAYHAGEISYEDYTAAYQRLADAGSTVLFDY